MRAIGAIKGVFDGWPKNKYGWPWNLTVGRPLQTIDHPPQMVGRV